MDKDLVTKLSLLAAFIGLIMLAKLGYYRYKVVNLTDRGRVLAELYVKEQKEYYDRNKEYIYDVHKIRNFQSLDPALHVYHEEAVVPEEYKAVIDVEGIPFMNKDDYRIYVGVKNHFNNKLYFWKVDAKDRPELLVTDIQLDSVAGSN